MKKSNSLIAVIALGTIGLASGQTLINGAGSTFPATNNTKWLSENTKLNKHVQFNYQPLGSGRRHQTGYGRHGRVWS